MIKNLHVGNEKSEDKWTWKVEIKSEGNGEKSTGVVVTESEKSWIQKDKNQPFW